MNQIITQKIHKIRLKEVWRLYQNSLDYSSAENLEPRKLVPKSNLISFNSRNSYERIRIKTFEFFRKKLQFFRSRVPKTWTDIFPGRKAQLQKSPKTDSNYKSLSLNRIQKFGDEIFEGLKSRVSKPWKVASIKFLQVRNQMSRIPKNWPEIFRCVRIRTVYFWTWNQYT